MLHMIKLKSLTKNKEHLVQHLLSQVDTLGSFLRGVGIKNNINRHTLIGQAWVQKNRIEGELDRIDLRMHLTARPIIKIRQKVDQTIDQAIDYLPEPLAQRAHKTHHQIKRLSGGC